MRTGVSSRSVQAALAVVAAQVSVNLGAGIGKSLFGAVGPEGVVLLRTALGAMLLVALTRPWNIRLDRGDFRRLAAYGIALGAMNLLFYLAIARIPLGVAVAIEIAGPLAVVVFTSRSRRDLAWLALAVLGLAMLLPWPGRDVALDPLGIAFAFGAAVGWALYIVYGKRASQVPGRVAVAWGMVFACLVTAPFGLARAGTALLDAHILAMGLAVAVLSSALPFALEMIGLKQLSNAVFGMIVSSSPAIAAVCGYILLGEHLTLVEWLAVGMMIAASAGSTLTARDDTPATEIQPTISSGLKK